MNTTCPRCNALLEPNTSFCTSCGAVLATQNPQNPYSQQGTPSTPQNPYAQPYGQQQAQVPPWASAGNAGYASYGQPQQGSGGQIDPSAGGSLGFGGQGDGTAKKILTIGVTIIAITIVLLIVFGILAWAIPALHCLFLGFIVLLFVIPWFIYSYIRNMIRRSVGGVGRLF
jgi:uncharacterized membrane protein YphA (DoxX/SURF4 family)